MGCSSSNTSKKSNEGEKAEKPQDPNDPESLNEDGIDDGQPRRARRYLV